MKLQTCNYKCFLSADFNEIWSGDYATGAYYTTALFHCLLLIPLWLKDAQS
jgi:hypothetical protein